MIKEITKDILENNKVVLEQIEAREIFDEIYQGLSGEITSTAFIVALQKIVKTEETLQAIIEASTDAVKKPTSEFKNAFQTISTSYCSDYLDIYFAVDIINSANNITTIKYATDKFNNTDTFKTFAIQGQNYSREFLDNLEETNFCYYYLDKDEKYLKYTNEIRKNFDFENIFDFIDCFLNPFGIKNHMIGTSNTDDVQKTAKLALLLKYDNTITLTSAQGLPYATLDKENTIAEAWKNKIFTYTLNSELLDLPNYSIDKIKTENNKESLEIIKKVFDGKIKDAPYYTIILNSALSLYISKNASSIMDGIKIAQKTIDSGLAMEKIKQIEKSLQKFK